MTCVDRRSSAAPRNFRRDPAATTLEVYRLDGEGWRLVQTYAGDVTIRPEPFDAVDLDLGSLWSR